MNKLPIIKNVIQQRKTKRGDTSVNVYNDPERFRGT